MFHRYFTTQQLSKILKIATVISIISLLIILLQAHYLPDAVILKTIINLIHHTSFCVVALIIISQVLIIFRKNHPQLIAHYNIIALSIELFLASLIFLILTIVHHTKSSFIEFYNNKSIAPGHSIKIVWLLIFITGILIYDVYKTIKEGDKKVNDKKIKEIIFKESHLLIRYSLIVAASFFGILQITSLHQFAILTSNFMYSKLILYSEIFGYMVLALWIITPFYYLYKFYQKSK